MKVKVRPLNEGETFCCSIRKAKEVFRNTDVYLDFSYLGRDYSTWQKHRMRISGKEMSRGE